MNNTTYITSIKGKKQVNVQAEISNTISKEVSVVFLSGNIPYDMSSFGPYFLFKVKEQHLYEIQVANIKKVLPNSEIIFVTGFESYKLSKRRSGFRIIENQLFEHTNEAEQIRLAINNIQYNNLLIVIGNTLFNTDVMQNINLDKDAIWYNQHQEHAQPGLCILDNYAINISYGLNTNIWCNMIYLTKDSIKKFYSLCNIIHNKNKFLCEILTEFLPRNHIYAYSPINMRTFCIHTPKDLRYINENFNW